MSEQFTFEREDRIKSTIDSLRDRTPEERAAGLENGIDMLVEDLPENREFYARMQGRKVLELAGFREHSETMKNLDRELYGPLGYDTSVAESKK